MLVARLLLDHPPSVALVALAAFLGHLYPVFFDFRGGKGVATALGALLGTSVTVGALAIVAWLAVSLTSAAPRSPPSSRSRWCPAFLLIEGERTYAVLFVGIAALLFWTHRANLARLAAGTEPTIGKR